MDTHHRGAAPIAAPAGSPRCVAPLPEQSGDEALAHCQPASMPSEPCERRAPGRPSKWAGCQVCNSDLAASPSRFYRVGKGQLGRGAGRASGGLCAGGRKRYAGDVVLRRPSLTRPRQLRYSPTLAWSA